MGELRERLREMSPELSDVLERNWAIAMDEWLPALGVNLGSFNSYPHLRNVEQYLDRIVPEIGEKGDPRGELLSATEMYLLLAAVLFHDIGRLKPDAGSGHGKASRDMIMAHWAELGVPSQRLAECLGDICLYHDPPSKEDRNSLDGRLHDIVIAPHGRIRPRSIATLLTLADHLDSAFTRVLPTYVREPEEIKVVGMFRGLIRGVHVEPEAHMVRTVLGRDMEPPEDRGRDGGESPLCSGAEGRGDTEESHMLYVPNWGRGVELYALLSRLLNRSGTAGLRNGGDPAQIARSCLPQIKGEELVEWGLAPRKGARIKIFKKLGYADSVEMIIRNYPTDWLTARQLLHAQRVQGPWPRLSALCVVLGNIRENAEVLRQLYDNLAAMGLRLRSWVLDYQERLYNVWGEETFEPIFDLDYLKRVARGMWEVSSTVFGSSLFSYEDLAGHIAEPEVSKAKLAVRRIVLTTQPEAREDDAGPIWAGDFEWRWHIPRHSADSHDWSIQAVEEEVEQLVPPMQGEGEDGRRTC